MKKINLNLILLTFILTLFLSVLVSADNNKELVGSFQLKGDRVLRINSLDYAPLEEVARVLDYKYDWERVKTTIVGHLNYENFECEYFMISYGNLYLPLEDYENLFDLEVVRRGNRYYIYRNRPYIPPVTNSDLELVLQTDKTSYKRNEPIAVSLLLLNQGDRSYNLRFNNSMQYDLVLKRYNREIWRLSDNRHYLYSHTIEILKSGDYRLFTDLIEPGEDRYLSSSKYTLEAEIITTNGIVLIDKVNIDIY